MEIKSVENIHLNSRSNSSMNIRLENRKFKNKVVTNNPFFNFLHCFRREHPGNFVATARMAGMIWNKMSSIEKEPFRTEVKHKYNKSTKKDNHNKSRRSLSSKSSLVSIKNRRDKFPKPNSDIPDMKCRRRRSYVRSRKRSRFSSSIEPCKNEIVTRKSQSRSRSMYPTKSHSVIRGRKRKRRMSKKRRRRSSRGVKYPKRRLRRYNRCQPSKID